MCRLLAGGSAQAGAGWWRELKGPNKSTSAETYKNSAKNGQFPELFGLKIAENAVFCSKVRYTPKIFLRIH